MQIALFDKQLVVQRLTDQVNALRKVAGAAELAAAQPDLRQTPAAFVIETLNRTGLSSTGTEVVSQQNAVRFGVVIAAQNLRDARGDAAGDDLNTLRLAVMTALLGWKPGDDFDPCIYAGGQFVQMNDYTIWWQDDYATASLLWSAT